MAPVERRAGAGGGGSGVLELVLEARVGREAEVLSEVVELAELGELDEIAELLVGVSEHALEVPKLTRL